MKTINDLLRPNAIVPIDQQTTQLLVDELKKKPAMKTFQELRKISVIDKMKKKGRFNYLSWAYAVDVLLQEDKDANWEFKAPQMFGETMMVFCTVTAFGASRTAFLPVMNNNNQAIANPDANQVNKAMQRCLVKAIALHGIALYIFEGEDIPEEDDEPEKPIQKAKIEDARLLKAIDQIKSGKYTTDKLRAQFDLTEEQDKQVIEAIANA